MEKPVQHQNSKADSSTDKKEGVTAGDGRIGSGGNSANGDAMIRNHALQSALELHRGKGLDANKLVDEAMVLENYIRGGKSPKPDETVN